MQRLMWAALFVVSPALWAGPITGQELPFIEARYHVPVASMLERLRVEHSQCSKRMDLMTAGKSSSQGSAANPSFFVQCGDVNTPEVVRFSLSDALAGVAPSAAQAPDQSAAFKACLAAAKERASHPDSVDFSVLDSAYKLFPNGAAIFQTTFTASNGFGVSDKYSARCSFDGQRLNGVNIKPV